MRLEKRLFERFLKGVKEWLPSYYDSIVDTATIDDVKWDLIKNLHISLVLS